MPMSGRSPGFTPDFVEYMAQLESRLDSIAQQGGQAPAPDMSAYAKKTDLTSLAKKADIPDVSNLAPKNMIPSLSDAKPVSEAMVAKAGNAAMASRDDHTHERLTETFKGTLDTNGQAVITFSKTYAVQPVAIPQGIKAGAPISWDKEYMGTDGAWTGVKIIGYKAKPMPTTPVLSLTTLLGGVITGLNTLIGIVSGYNPVQVANGAAFDGYVLKSSQTG